MKKFFMCAVAVAATMSLTSCLSEEEVNLEKGNMGSISVKINADNSLTTRTAVEDATKWYTFIDGTTKDFGTADNYVGIGTLTNEVKFPFGSYTVNVSNYANEAKAFAANSGWGDAYYNGSEPLTVNAGIDNPVTVECGKAQNAKLTVETSGFTGTATEGLYFTSIVTKQNDDSRELTFAGATLTNNAFYPATEKVKYTVSWKFGGTEKSHSGTITLAGAGTANKISVASNSDGTISINKTTGITYDETWIEGKTETITIRADNGEKL